MSLLVYTRPGYEGYAAQECNAILQHQDWAGYSRPWPGLGFCELLPAEGPATAPVPHFKGALVFARQWLNPAARLEGLPTNDRITPLLAQLRSWLPSGEIAGFHIEHPDTNEGRELARFCKKFAGAFLQGLKKAGFQKLELADKGSGSPALPWVHICFDSYESCFIGLRFHEHPPWSLGIPRLKMPKDAPSRSTLKLEEAFLRLLTPFELERLLAQSGPLQAVDLGAAPGGWTYHLLKRGYHVIAVDNGSLREELLQTGQVEHLRADAFHFRPKSQVHLMVCDVVDQPAKVTSLMEKWFCERWCQTAIFNLKLPMKKKLPEIQNALDRLRSFKPKLLRACHLYHDRDEVTFIVSMKDLQPGKSQMAKH